MSRTFRRRMLSLDKNDNRIMDSCYLSLYGISCKHDYYSKRNFKRDKKDQFKPKKYFKKMRSRVKKAKIKNALRLGKEVPFFKRDNEWYWN